MKTDGLCQPNPDGLSTWGLVAWIDGEIVERSNGVAVVGPGATNNVAEYHGVIQALTWMAPRSEDSAGAEVYTDSQLVVKQVLGQWKVKKAHLQDLAIQAQTLLRGQSNTTLGWVPREQNTDADEESRKAMRSWLASNATLNGKPVRLCPECEASIMEVRNGKHGRFFGCLSYPKCKGTAPAPRS